MYRKSLVMSMVLVALFTLSQVLPALACGGGDPSGLDDPNAPKPIVLAAFQALSQQLGAPLSPDLIPWQWSEEVFANSTLECPRAGQAVDHTWTRGYRVVISVSAKGRFTDYVFHATKDGQLLFQCLSTGPGPRIQVNPA